MGHAQQNDPKMPNSTKSYITRRTHL